MKQVPIVLSVFSECTNSFPSGLRFFTHSTGTIQGSHNLSPEMNDTIVNTDDDWTKGSIRFRGKIGTFSSDYYQRAGLITDLTILDLLLVEKTLLDSVVSTSNPPRT